LRGIDGKGWEVGPNGAGKYTGASIDFTGVTFTPALLTKTVADAAYSPLQSIRINQTAHGFANGNPARHDGTKWVKPGAPGQYPPLDDWAGVVKVVDANNFDLFTSGKVTGLAGLAVGVNYWSGTAWTTTKPTTFGAFEGKVIADTTSSGIVAPFRRRSSFFQPVTTLPAQVGYLFGNSDVMLAVVGNSLYQSQAGSAFTMVKQFPGTGIQTLTDPGDNYLYVGLKGISGGFGAWVWRAAYPFNSWSQYGSNWGQSAFSAVGAIWKGGSNIYASPTGSSNRATFQFTSATAQPQPSNFMSKLGTVNGSFANLIYGTQGNVAYLLQGNNNAAADVAGFPATDQNALSMFVSDSNLYVGSSPTGNVYARENNVWSTIATPANNVYGIVVDANNLYIATEKGVYLTSLTGDRKSWGLIYNKDTRSIGVTAKGELYIGTSGGEILVR
jgi:hypothetical protein